MTFDEARAVADELTLPSGDVWPIPILLQTHDLPHDTTLTLVHGEEIIGTLRLIEAFPIPLRGWAAKIYGTDDEKHPGVAAFYRAGAFAIAGDIDWRAKRRIAPAGIEWLTASEVRHEIARRGWSPVAGFQTRHPIHRPPEYLLPVPLPATPRPPIHPPPPLT